MKIYLDKTGKVRQLKRKIQLVKTNQKERLAKERETKKIRREN